MAMRARVVWYWIDSEGRPIPGATVSVRNAANDAQIADTIYAFDDPDTSQLTNGSFTSAADGRIEFYLVTAQRVTLRLSKSGYTSQDIPVDVTYVANRFTFRSAWSGATTYAQDDVVTYGGESWIALRTSTNVTPVEGDDWSKMAEKGVTTVTGGIDDTLIDDKGDLLVGTADDTVARKAVGANGSLLVTDSAQSDGLRWGVPTEAYLASQQTTGSTSFTDLATVGPAVTVVTGTQAIVIISAELYNTDDGGGARVGVAVSGATTIAASNDRSLYSVNGASRSIQASHVSLVTGLTAGSNTFTLKYLVDSGTGNFLRRRITVIPL